MKEEVDPNSGDTWIHLNEEEVKYGFLSQCIEAVAEAENCNYVDILTRMEQVDMTTGYILANYEVLHTLSWEAVVSELRALLHRRESETTNGHI